LAVERCDGAIWTIFPDNSDISLGKSVGKSSVPEGNRSTKFDDTIEVAISILKDTIDDGPEDDTLGRRGGDRLKLTIDGNEDDYLSVNLPSNGERASWIRSRRGGA
jgi:hypothetical protein